MQSHGRRSSDIGCRSRLAVPVARRAHRCSIVIIFSSILCLCFSLGEFVSGAPFSLREFVSVDPFSLKEFAFKLPRVFLCYSRHEY